MKPLAQYDTAEAMQADAVREPGWSKIPVEKRPAVLNDLRQRWQVDFAARKEAEGAKPEDLQGHVDGLAHTVASFLAKAAVGTGRFIHDTQAYEPGIGLFDGHPIQGAIDLALFGLGPEAVEGKAATNALWRLTKRLAIPTIAGTAGGAMEGKPGTGAATGLAEGLGGEAIAGGLKLGNRTISALDFARLRGWLEPRLGISIPDMATFRKVFTNGEGVAEAEARHTKVVSSVERKIGKGFKVTAPTSVPGTSQQYMLPQTLREVEDKLNELEGVGWRADRSPNPTHAGRAARDQVHAIEGDVAQQLDQVNPKAAQEWYTSRGRVRTARTLKQFFDEPGMITDGDKINFIKGQQLAQSTAPGGYAYDLEQSMGPSEQKSFAKMLRRGAPEGTNDRAGRGLLSGDKDYSNVTVTTHGGLWGHISMPWPSRHVGQVPFDLGRGRALSALLTLGPQRFFQTINDLTATSPDAPNGAVAAH